MLIQQRGLRLTLPAQLDPPIRCNVTVIFGALMLAVFLRFVRSGGLPMLRIMNGAPDAAHDHRSHGGHEHGTHAGATVGPAA